MKTRESSPSALPRVRAEQDSSGLRKSVCTRLRFRAHGHRRTSVAWTTHTEWQSSRAHRVASEPDWSRATADSDTASSPRRDRLHLRTTSTCWRFPATSGTAQRRKKVVAAAKERFGRVDTLVNNAGIFVSQAVRRVHAGGLRRGDRDQRHRALSHHAGRSRGAALAAERAHREHQRGARRSTSSLQSRGPRRAHQGRRERAHEVARDRGREERSAGQRRRAGHHQDADARTGHARLSRQAACPWDAWAK